MYLRHHATFTAGKYIDIESSVHLATDSFGEHEPGIFVSQLKYFVLVQPFNPFVALPCCSSLVCSSKIEVHEEVQQATQSNERHGNRVAAYVSWSFDRWVKLRHSSAKLGDSGSMCTTHKARHDAARVSYCQLQACRRRSLSISRIIAWQPSQRNAHHNV